MASTLRPITALVAQQVHETCPHALFLVRGEFERAPFDLRAVQPCPMERPALDIPQLALGPPLNARAARAGRLVVETLAASLVNAVPLHAPKVMAAKARPVETVAAARFALSRERVALRRGPPTGHERGAPSREVLLVSAPKIFSKSHPQTTLLRRGNSLNYGTFRRRSASVLELVVLSPLLVRRARSPVRRGVR
jgi:hypothetical protein